MRVAIDKGPLSGGHRVRGIGFYTKNLATALEKYKSEGMEIEVVDFVANREKLARYDVVHYLYFDLFFKTLPMRKPTRTVITIHDVISLIYPSRYPPGIRGRLRFVLQKYSLKSVAMVITDTEASKKDIIRFLGVPKEKIKVIHLAPASSAGVIRNRRELEKVREKYGLPSKFVLYVGDVNYNKNVGRLVKACKKANVQLVVVGKQAASLDVGSNLKDLKGPMDWLRFMRGRNHPEEEHYSELLGLFERWGVLRLGYVSDDELRAIYNLATVYCQPSLYEGFGLPPLEAMACGCPVVVSRTQAVVEVCEGGAVFFDSKDVDDMVDKISEVLESATKREKLIENGQKIVAKYSWKKTATETARVYRTICDK